MNPTITLDVSVMDADHYKVHKFKKDRNFLKFLEAIAMDDEFSEVDGVVYYTGKKLNSKPQPKAQQVRAFHPLGYPDVLTSFDRASVNLTDIYRGCTGFLVLSGPSARELDLSLLEKPGLLKMCVNNSSRLTRPNLWTCVDPPDRFLYSVWADPTVMKFVPDSFRNKSLWDSYKDKPIFDRVVGDCPNVFYYPRNNNFVPGAWLRDTSINWGQSGDHSFYDYDLGKNVSGVRSCMLVAVRIMAMLGVRTIFLVGADFHMDPKKPYAFDQDKGEGGARSNNNAYKKLNSFFNVLKPHFQAINLHIFNTNPKSGLHSFDYMPYEDAIKFALQDVGDPSQEQTAHMYDNIKDKRKRLKKEGKEVNQPILTGLWDPNTYQLNAPTEGKETEAEEKQPDPPSADEVKMAQKLRYRHKDLLETGGYWASIYPELGKTLHVIKRRKLALAKGDPAAAGGCRKCRKKRRRQEAKEGKKEQDKAAMAQLKMLVDVAPLQFASALFAAISKNPDTMKNHPTYRPKTMIQGKNRYFRLEEIVAGADFGD